VPVKRLEDLMREVLHPTLPHIDCRCYGLECLIEDCMHTGKGGQGGPEGVGGLRYLGARELTYKLAFLASSTQVW